MESLEAFAKADEQWLNLTLQARQWLDSAHGQQLQSDQLPLLEHELERCFGSYLVHFGPASWALPCAPQIRHRIRLGAPLSGVNIVCDEHSWPLSENTADVVVLQHALDFCLSPHALLREAARSVRPGGHLLMVGINPWSSWGLRHYFARDGFRRARCIGAGRLADWLSLLGFELEKRSFGCYRPPLCASHWQQRLALLERWGQRLQAPGSGYYLLVARKRVVGLRPWRPQLRSSMGKLLPMPVAKVSRRDADNPPRS